MTRNAPLRAIQTRLHLIASSSVVADHVLQTFPNRLYLNSLREVFSSCCVLFLGYGLRDDYLIGLLSESSNERPIFGAGPHFLVTAGDASHVPDTVNKIRYVSAFADHRDSLQVLEAVINCRQGKSGDVRLVEESESREPKSTIFYLADLVPFGTIQTSQTVEFASKDGVTGQMIIGDGYVDGEVPLSNYSALHDLVVGLICYDKVAFPIHHISVVHNLVGSETFWELLRLEALQVVRAVEPCGVIFSNQTSVIGDLGDFTLGSSASSEDRFQEIGVSELIRKHLSAVSGKEEEAEASFQFLANSVVDVAAMEVARNLGEKTRAAVLHPSMRELLGVSAGTPYGVVPRWVAYSMIRLSRVMATGITCQALGASATRMIWGSERLASSAFASAAGEVWADDAASYVLTGKFNSDIGSAVAADPSLIRNVIAFRSSSDGERFRREVADRLGVDSGADVAATINSGLRQALPATILEQARNQFSGLFVSREKPLSLLPAFWGNLKNGDVRIAGWRKRSRAILQEECRRLKLSGYHLCPCGSGEKLKFCCQDALQ